MARRLITLKLTAGRAKDLVDIQSLAAAEGNRDRRREPPSVISSRLRAALQLDARQCEGVDMSAQAVTTRLREAAELSTLCLELAAAGARSR